MYHPNNEPNPQLPFDALSLFIVTVTIMVTTIIIIIDIDIHTETYPVADEVDLALLLLLLLLPEIIGNALEDLEADSWSFRSLPFSNRFVCDLDLTDRL